MRGELGSAETETCVVRRTYSIEEVAKILGLSRNSAYIAARNNQLPVATIRVGRRMMVSRAALDQLVSGDIV